MLAIYDNVAIGASEESSPLGLEPLFCLFAFHRQSQIHTLSLNQTSAWQPFGWDPLGPNGRKDKQADRCSPCVFSQALDDVEQQIVAEAIDESLSDGEHGTQRHFELKDVPMFVST
ncbi:predicted protein [Sclerotinia sclerotiorum 1980 UF-70]|uniref:Uncharacterized protein n=1 Tax=Sclerotinia sclerotiorum (strain ATCC 18683 / 1980 / Ss-1) TaxID=665079 RepID=A7E654_SCLS1|nr:predicted protein [Sclerotinia sclerotiorum 1980 UF-70]EDN91376.1 predicted protein [Sclerotinia sclerotiorum 1980 UF-70]